MTNPLVIGTAAVVLAAAACGSSFVLSKLMYAHGGNALILVALRFLALLVVRAGWLRIPNPHINNLTAYARRYDHTYIGTHAVTRSLTG